MKSKIFRVAACWGMCLLALPCTALAQMNMTMPPADLCAGDSSATVVPAGTTLAPPAVATYGCLSVHGTLDLSSVRTLTVRTLHQHGDGTIRLAPDGVARTIQIADVKPTDMGQFGTGLVMEGRIEIEGVAKTAWTRLTAELLAGQNTMEVADATGWQVGDRLVVADSRDPWPSTVATTPQEFTVAAVSGTTVTLDRPASIAHPPSLDCVADGANPCASYAPGRYAPVGNLTRSLVIRSVNPAGARGHIMVTMGATGYIRNVEIRDMGRTTDEFISATNPKGRYAAHLHFVETPGFEFAGNAIHGATKWGITVHHTNGGIIRQNVVYDAWGAGVMTEDGTETDNVFDRNFAIGIKGDGKGADERGNLLEWGTGGNGFWFQGPLNRVTGNVAANTRTAGYILWGRDNQGQAMHEFRNNEAISGSLGIEVWYVGSSTVDSVIDRFFVWGGTTQGFYGYPNTRFIVQDFYMRGVPSAMSPDRWITGLGWGDYSTVDGALIRPDIQHVTFAVWLPYGNASGGGGGVRTFRVEGGSLVHNVSGLMTTTPGGSYDPSAQLPFHTIVRGLKTSGNLLGDIRRWFRLGEGENLVSLDMLDVYDHQGVVGDNFRLFYKESAPSFVLPAGNWLGGKPPLAGLTNAQAWDQHGKAIAGVVATCAAERPKIIGFACPVGAAPQMDSRAMPARPSATPASRATTPPSATPASSGTLPPSAPSNVRIVQK